jgi:hypothetical protein
VYFCWCPFVGKAAIGGQSGPEQDAFNNDHRIVFVGCDPTLHGGQLETGFQLPSGVNLATGGKCEDERSCSVSAGIS